MNKQIKNLTLAALFFCIGLVMPFLTMQIKQIGNMLLPMHLPVFLCGLIVGPFYGFVVGLLLPVTRSFIFFMPPLYPTAIAMSFELATYGFVAGVVYKHSKWKCIIALYESLLISMILGRIVWAIVDMILLGINGQVLTFNMFITATIINSIPGIILQLVFIPVIMLVLNKTGLIKFHKDKKVTEIIK